MGTIPLRSRSSGGGKCGFKEIPYQGEPNRCFNKSINADKFVWS